MYHLGNKSSAQIKALLDPERPDHRIHINDIDRIEAEGIRYSYEDYDVLSSALDAARQKQD
jgi:hypothetical protein